MDRDRYAVVPELGCIRHADVFCIVLRAAAGCFSRGGVVFGLSDDGLAGTVVCPSIK